MVLVEINPDVYSIVTIDWDSRLFDELIPLPNGTTYNSYIVKGSEKNALIDTANPTKCKEFIDDLKNAKIKNLDYIIPNHAEPDHSGSIVEVLELYPKVKVLTNDKCKDLLKALLHIPDNKFLTVSDNEKISLGNKTLEFIIAPWVHWPETMFTYLREDKILFPCDFLGSHYATNELYADKIPEIYSSAKRYFAEIMMPFRNNIKNHLKKLKNYDIKIIAPSHGPIHRKTEFILGAYQDWVSDEVKNEVLIAYSSMWGSVKKMVYYLTDELTKRKITVKLFNLSKTDIGELAMALVDAATVVIGSSTVLTGPHPNIVYASYLVNALRPKTKFISVLGSYGWGGKMLDIIKDLLKNLNAEILDPVIVRGKPREEDLERIKNLADLILQKHKEVNII
jgi:flavorubredoxin